MKTPKRRLSIKEIRHILETRCQWLQMPQYSAVIDALESFLSERNEEMVSPSPELKEAMRLAFMPGADIKIELPNAEVQP